LKVQLIIYLNPSLEKKNSINFYLRINLINNIKKSNYNYMLKNIANFLFNQSGGFTLVAPEKALGSLSVDELHKYIERVSLSLAQQVVDSKKDVNSCRDELTQALKSLYLDISSAGNSAFITDLMSRNLNNPQQFCDFALSYISTEVDRLRALPSRSKRSNYGIIAASPFGIIVSPLERYVNVSVRNAQDNAPLQPRTFVPRNQNLDGIPQRKVRF